MSKIASQPNGSPKTESKQPGGPRILSFAARPVLGLLSILVVLALLEGTSSTLLFIWDYWKNSPRPVAERVHTRYDELLGWVNVDNVTIKDLYGEGIDLRTNSLGFRADRDYDLSPPLGKLRIICSGDSFTLGYGVDNADTWCQILTSIDGRLETVNMGQGGYGIDQAFLWFKRDGARLEHDVHLFTFIMADFWRMRPRSFHGYGKPVLDLEDGQLVVRNRPVPRSLFAPWIARNRPILNRLRLMQLLETLLPQRPPEQFPTAAETRAVLLKVIEELQTINESKESLLAVVFLPTEADYNTDDSGELRQVLREELAKSGVIYIDLIPEIRTLPRREIGPLFIPREPRSRKYAYAGGHYSVKGNRYIARLIYDSLAAIPAFSSRLAQKTGNE